MQSHVQCWTASRDIHRAHSGSLKQTHLWIFSTFHHCSTPPVMVQYPWTATNLLHHQMAPSRLTGHSLTLHAAWRHSRMQHKVLTVQTAVSVINLNVMVTVSCEDQDGLLGVVSADCMQCVVILYNWLNTFKQQLFSNTSKQSTAGSATRYIHNIMWDWGVWLQWVFVFLASALWHRVFWYLNIDVRNYSQLSSSVQNTDKRVMKREIILLQILK